MSNTSSTYDVAIVGAGPSGLVLARLLSLRGRSVALIDPNRIVCQHPRATHLDDETMRTLQTLGAGDLEPRFLRQTGWKLTAEGAAFLEFYIPGEDTDQGWYSDYMFHQPDFESRLRGLLANDASVGLHLGVETIGLREVGDGVEVATRDLVAGEDGVIRASYVVGCDGANSFVRRAMGAEVEDLHGTQRSLIIDVHPFEHPATLPEKEGFALCDGERPLTFVPIFPPKLRFEFMLRPEDVAADLVRPSSVYELLRPWMEPGTYRILRTDVYEWHAYLVRGWRKDRVLVAGDAAHEMPPMLGQGMCSGLRDSVNLAWKLDAVLGGADESLLDTHESERAPHVRPYIEESARQSNMIESFIDPALRPEPGSEAQLLVRHRPLLGPGLAEEPGGAVGQLSPQAVGPDGLKLDDLVGYQFLVVGDAAVMAAVDDSVREAWARLGWVVIDSPPDALAAWLTEHDARAAIIRPDRYTYAVAADAASLSAASLELATRLSPVPASA